MAKAIVLFVGIVLVSGCFAPTPEVVRDRCLAHEAPRPPSAAQTAGRVVGSFLTVGVNVAVDNNRMLADCSEILGDDTLRESCPAWVTWCDQYLAERRNAAGATRVNVQQNSVQRNY